jgi:uncharacterized membrane protein YjjB (DUF3815 family)
VVSLATTEPGALRFDQTKALYRLVDDCAAGQVEPVDGLERLAVIADMTPRFNRGTKVVGVVLIAVGIALVLDASWADLAAATALSVVVGLLRVAAEGRQATETVLPALASFLVGFGALTFAEYGWVEEPVRVVTPALVTLLPGAMLTIGAIELSAGSLASGSGRMVAGFYSLLLLTFGLVVAGSVVGLTTADDVSDPVTAGLAPWAPWVGVGIYVVGVGLAFSVPKGTWISLYLVSYTAWGMQVLTSELVIGYVSAFAGAAVGVLVASLAYRHLDGPPALLSFTPAFWLLVPGGLSLLGVTRATAGTTGSAQISTALFTIVGIALGVVIGRGADRTLTERLGW